MDGLTVPYYNNMSSFSNWQLKTYHSEKASHNATEQDPIICRINDSLVKSVFTLNSCYSQHQNQQSSEQGVFDDK